MASRLAAWLVTGPAGHFAAGAVDAAVLIARAAGAAARKRLTRRRRQA